MIATTFRKRPATGSRNCGLSSGLQQRLTLLDARATAVVPRPNAVRALARDVDTLHEMLKDNPDSPECRIALGNLIERVLVHPTGFREVL